MTNPLRDIFVIPITIAKQCFNGFFSLCDDWFPASGPILRITTIKTADRWVFKMATGCSKWLPTVFLDGFLALQAPKMSAPMEGLRWTVSYSAHWNAFNVFQLSFLFCFMTFSLYSDFAGMN